MDETSTPILGLRHKLDVDHLLSFFNNNAPVINILNWWLLYFDSTQLRESFHLLILTHSKLWITVAIDDFLVGKKLN